MSGTKKLALWLAALLGSQACLATEVSEATLRDADAGQMRIIVDGDAKAQGRFMHQIYIFIFEYGKWSFLARQASVVGK